MTLDPSTFGTQRSHLSPYFLPFLSASLPKADNIAVFLAYGATWDILWIKGNVCIASLVVFA